MSNDSLISRLANARAIASQRLPAADVAAIDDAIATLTTQPQADRRLTAEGGALAALLDDLRKATDLDGFGCACEPNAQCGVCAARSVMFKLVTPLVNRYAALPQPQAAEPADAKDAARYRWLRDHSQPGICTFYLSVGNGLHGVKFTRETVDEAIDAQIATPTAPTEPT